MSSETSQMRHEKLIQFLSQFSQYQTDGKPRFKIAKKIITSDKVKDIDTDDINGAVVVFTDTLNLSGGSIGGNINLYELLQAYLKVPQYRAKINEVVAEALSFSYKNP